MSRVVDVAMVFRGILRRPGRSPPQSAAGPRSNALDEGASTGSAEGGSWLGWRWLVRRRPRVGAASNSEEWREMLGSHAVKCWGAIMWLSEG